jgi:predicted transcriptional regulator
MAVIKKTRPVRRSVSLPADVHRRVERLARQQKRSANRVLERLVEKGLAAEEAERQRLHDLVERLRATDDPQEKQRLGDELGRMVFGG